LEDFGAQPPSEIHGFSNTNIQIMKFIKYLPVDGEIGPTDFFIDGDEKVVSVRELLQAQPDYNLTSLNKARTGSFPVPEKFRPKKAVPFLCSSDVQMGELFFTDTSAITSFLGLQPKQRVMDRLFQKVLEENPLLSNHIYKVIKEVAD
jgi:hypothetical protein